MSLKVILRFGLCGAITLGFFASRSVVSAALITNNYFSTSDGKWETGSNWSNGAPSNNFHAIIIITNANTKTVTVDATTAGFPGVMTTSNLFLSAPVNSTNTLFLNNAGLLSPLTFVNSVTISTGGALTITNSTLRVLGVSGGQFTVDGGSVLLNTGIIATTNITAVIGHTVSGSQMTVANGTWLGTAVTVGNATGSGGTLTLAGGLNRFDGAFTVASSLASTGTVWLTGGQLIVTNSSTTIGGTGAGQMTVSNGTMLTDTVKVGNFAGSQGSLTIAGGSVTNYGTLTVGELGAGNVKVTGGQLTATNTVLIGNFAGSQGTLTVAGGTADFSGTMFVGYNANSTGTVWVTGGQLVTTNGFTGTRIGEFGVGQMTVSNGTFVSSGMQVGANSGGRGTLTVAGGTVSVTSLLNIGQQGGTGTVWVTGGQFVHTNGQLNIGISGSSTGSVGVLTVSNGTVLLREVNVGSSGVGSRGTLTVAGGTVTVVAGSSLRVGTSTTTGGVFVSGGVLAVTNSTTTINASGRVTINGGTMLVRDIEFNSGGTLTLSAGTLGIGGSFTFTGVSSQTNFTGGTVLVLPNGLLRMNADSPVAVTNRGNIQLLANSVGFNGGLANEANFTVNGGQVVTVLNGLGNSGNIFVTAGGILSADGMREGRHTGSLFLNNGGQFSVASAWTNAGVVNLQFGGVSGGSIHNEGLVEGAGGITAPLINRDGGSVRAVGGVLSLTGSDIQNQAGAFMEADAGATLRLSRTLVNQGVINPQGGVIDLQSNSLTNQGTMTGFGTYKAKEIVNDGRATFLGGNLNVQATYINNASKTTEVRFATASFFGAVTNNAGGVIKNTGSDITFFNAFFNNGSFISDPATNTFNATLTLGTSGELKGGAGDVFIINGSLLSANPNGLDLPDAEVVFGLGAHDFTLAGTAHFGTLQLAGGASVSLAGGDIIVGIFSASPNQFTTAQTIFYDPALSPWLEGQTYSLTGGGLLTAVPEPSTWLMVILALAVLARGCGPRTLTRCWGRRVAR